MSSLNLHWPQWKNNEVFLPESKSWRNRFAIIQGLCGQTLREPTISEADDVHRMYQALISREHDINVGGAGTAYRFLTAYYALQASKTGTTYRLDGNDQMRKRPIGALVDALQLLGAKIEYVGNAGFPPLLIKPSSLKSTRIHWSNRESSQFLSALMLIAPYLPKGLEVKWSGDLPSKTYLELTAELMKSSGVSVELGTNRLIIPSGGYDPSLEIRPEGDWSSAAFWLSALMIRGRGSITFNGLHLGTQQGDEKLIQLYKKWGLQVTDSTKGVHAALIERNIPDKIQLNLSEAPDLVPTLATLAVGLKIPGQIIGIGHLKFKESNRLESLKNELQKWGALVEINNESLKWGSFSRAHENIEHETYGDHRIAMAFAPLSQIQPIKIHDPEVVAKSYPNFWEDGIKLGLIKL